MLASLVLVVVLPSFVTALLWQHETGKGRREKYHDSNNSETARKLEGNNIAREELEGTTGKYWMEWQPICHISFFLFECLQISRVVWSTTTHLASLVSPFNTTFISFLKDIFAATLTISSSVYCNWILWMSENGLLGGTVMKNEDV